jgi:hypothetical protein
LGHPYQELGEAVLRGDIRIQDIDGDDKANIVWIQDYVTQVGVSRTAERRSERLIRADSGALMYRNFGSGSSKLSLRTGQQAMGSDRAGHERLQPPASK